MIIKQLSEMNLIDNYLATVSMGHVKYGKEIVGTILKPIIGREIRIKESIVENPIFPAEPGKHGVRLDAYVVEDIGEVEVEHGNIYDLEPDQNRDDKEILPLRSRFYHSMLDKRALESGKNYDALPNAWVIFIVSYDPFGKDRMLYTIRNYCIEEPEMTYNDRATTLYLYVNGRNTDNCTKELQELLRYMNESTEENACNSDLKKIHSYITSIKSEPATQEGLIMWSAYIEGELKKAAKEANARTKEANARADAEKKRADAEKERADAAEIKILELQEKIRRYEEAR